MNGELEVKGHDSRQAARAGQWPGRPIGWALRGLAIVALAGAAYLTIISWPRGPAPAGCGGLPQFDCDHVLNSHWARWFGIPVSLLAVVVYGSMVVASFLIGPRIAGPVRHTARFALVMLATLGAGAAVWFLSLLGLALGKLCVFCVLVHLCGLAIGFLVLAYPPLYCERRREGWLRMLRASIGRPARRDLKPPDGWLTANAVVSAVCLGLISVSLFIVTQLAVPPRIHRLDWLPRVRFEQPADPPPPPKQPPGPPSMASVPLGR